MPLVNVVIEHLEVMRFKRCKWNFWFW